MTPKLVLGALCTMALTGCAQFEDCPGRLPGTAFGSDSPYSEAPNSPNSPYWTVPSGEQRANGHISDETPWCVSIYTNEGMTIVLMPDGKTSEYQRIVSTERCYISGN